MASAAAREQDRIDREKQKEKGGDRDRRRGNEVDSRTPGAERSAPSHGSRGSAPIGSPADKPQEWSWDRDWNWDRDREWDQNWSWSSWREADGGGGWDKEKSHCAGWDKEKEGGDWDKEKSHGAGWEKANEGGGREQERSRGTGWDKEKGDGGWHGAGWDQESGAAGIGAAVTKVPPPPPGPPPDDATPTRGKDKSSKGASKDKGKGGKGSGASRASLAAALVHAGFAEPAAGRGPVPQNRFHGTSSTGPVPQDRYHRTGSTSPVPQDWFHRTGSTGSEGAVTGAVSASGVGLVAGIVKETTQATPGAAAAKVGSANAGDDQVEGPGEFYDGYDEAALLAELEDLDLEVDAFFADGATQGLVDPGAGGDLAGLAALNGGAQASAAAGLKSEAALEGQQEARRLKPPPAPRGPSGPRGPTMSLGGAPGAVETAVLDDDIPRAIGIDLCSAEAHSPAKMPRLRVAKKDAPPGAKGAAEARLARAREDMGLTPLQREAARSARYGAGLQTQFITQDGDRFTVVDQLKTTNTMKFQVGLGPQTTCNLDRGQARHRHADVGGPGPLHSEHDRRWNCLGVQPAVLRERPDGVGALVARRQHHEAHLRQEGWLRRLVVGAFHKAYPRLFRPLSILRECVPEACSQRPTCPLMPDPRSTRAQRLQKCQDGPTQPPGAFCKPLGTFGRFSERKTWDHPWKPCQPRYCTAGPIEELGRASLPLSPRPVSLPSLRSSSSSYSVPFSSSLSQWSFGTAANVLALKLPRPRVEPQAASQRKSCAETVSVERLSVVQLTLDPGCVCVCVHCPVSCPHPPPARPSFSLVGRSLPPAPPPYPASPPRSSLRPFPSPSSFPESWTLEVLGARRGRARRREDGSSRWRWRRRVPLLPPRSRRPVCAPPPRRAWPPRGRGFTERGAAFFSSAPRGRTPPLSAPGPPRREQSLTMGNTTTSGVWVVPLRL
ncbi:unnamed protein product [Prorocentrum cordatum]|nr:unnamed protein product [Polarella glacialis]